MQITDTEVKILEQVQFDTGKATIKRASDGLLDNLKTHASHKAMKKLWELTPEERLLRAIFGEKARR